MEVLYYNLKELKIIYFIIVQILYHLLLIGQIWEHKMHIYQYFLDL